MSKQTITGVLDKCYERNGKFSINVNDTWYSTWKNDYRDMEGQTVSFEAESVRKGNRTYWNVAGDVEVIKQAAPAGGGAASSTPADARQQSIVLQSSYKIGADVLGSMVAAGALSLGTKKADQYGAMLDYLDEIAVRIYSNCIDPVTFLEGREDFMDDEEPAIPDDDEYNPLDQ